MKKIVSKILALALTASLLLTACGTSSNDEGTTSGDNSTEQTTESTGDESESTESTGNEITDLVIPKLATREIQTFDILYSQSFNDLENLTMAPCADAHGALSVDLSLTSVFRPAPGCSTRASGRGRSCR